MLKLLLFILILCAAVFAGPWLADSQGFVHIAGGDYVVETSLTTAVILLIIAFIVLFFLGNLLIKLWRMPRGTRKLMVRRKARKASSLQEEAALALAEGDSSRALALIEKIGPASKLSVECLFTGARAAFNKENYELCRTYLEEAKGRDKQSFIASGIIRARLNMQIGNNKAALEVLDELKDKNVRSKEISRLTFECYRNDNDKEHLKELVPSLLRSHVITREEAAACLQQDMQDKAAAASGKDVLTLADSLSRKDRQNAQVVAPVISKLVSAGELNRARKLTLDILKKHRQTPEFLESIGNWTDTIPEVLALLKKQAEKNLIASDMNVPLLKALGNLSFKAGELKDAQEYYEKALQLSKSSDLYLKLARIMTAQRLFERATNYYALALQDKPALQSGIRPVTA